MNRLITLLGIATLACGCPTDRQPAEQDLKAEVQSIYDQIAQSAERNDIDGVTRYSLPTATVRYADGTELSVAQWKELAQRAAPAVKQTKARIAVSEVVSHGDAAEATYTETHDTLVADPQGVGDHAIHYDATWRALLRRTPDGWRLSRSEELQRRITRDGKLIDERPKPATRPGDRGT